MLPRDRFENLSKYRDLPVAKGMEMTSNSGSAAPLQIVTVRKPGGSPLQVVLTKRSGRQAWVTKRQSY